MGVNRMQFMLESISDLNKQLEKALNSKLVVAKGKPEDIFKGLFNLYNVHTVTIEGEQVEPYGEERDILVRSICQ